MNFNIIFPANVVELRERKETPKPSRCVASGVVFSLSENNIDLWLLSRDSVFALSLLIAFISPPHLPISLCLRGGHLDCLNASRKLPSLKREREGWGSWDEGGGANSWGNGRICGRPSWPLRAPCRYIEPKDFQMEKSFRSVMHLNRRVEFRSGYYCRRAQPALPSPSSGRKEGGAGVGSRFSPPSHPWSHGVVWGSPKCAMSY